MRVKEVGHIDVNGDQQCQMRAHSVTIRVSGNELPDVVTCSAVRSRWMAYCYCFRDWLANRCLHREGLGFMK
jgi:hypothetical protein